MSHKGAPKGNKYGLVHGHAARGKKSPTWQSWRSMVTRCCIPTHSNYQKYGGRGITVTKRWLPENDGFNNFLADMGERPSGMTLERRRVNGDYTPGNCRWATKQEQNNNRTVTVRIKYQGKTQSLKEWADELGLPYDTLFYRVRKYGWPVRRAFTEPVHSKRAIPLS